MNEHEFIKIVDVLRKELLNGVSKEQVRNKAKQILIIVETYCFSYYESHSDNTFNKNDRRMAVEHFKENLQFTDLDTEKMKSQLEYSINHILTTFTGLGVGDIMEIVNRSNSI